MIASLAGAVAVLFRLLESKNTEAISTLQKHVQTVELRLADSDRRHDECQVDRAKLAAEVAVFKDYMTRAASFQMQIDDLKKKEDE